MATIDRYQQRRSELLESDSAALDVDLLLCHVLDKTRAFLYAYPEYVLSSEQIERLDLLLHRRRKGEPVAHLIGRSEFWSLPLKTSAATLIPRPDTESLVETVLGLYPNAPGLSVLDLGTGTGAIALALASERPAWDITAIDLSPEAVELAKVNADSLGLGRIRILCSDWFSALPGERFDLIVSNPPYIEDGDPHLKQGDLRYEPHSALVSGAEGLDDIRRISVDALHFLKPGGRLVLEHGFRQAESVADELAKCGYTDIEARRDYGGNLRLTFARVTPSGDSNYAG